VSTDDVAALVAAVALEPNPPPLVEFGRPEAISRNEAVGIAERLTGRAFKRQRMPLFAAKLAMRALARPNDALRRFWVRASYWMSSKPPGTMSPPAARHHPAIGERLPS